MIEFDYEELVMIERALSSKINILSTVLKGDTRSLIRTREAPYRLLRKKVRDYLRDCEGLEP